MRRRTLGCVVWVLYNSSNPPEKDTHNMPPQYHTIVDQETGLETSATVAEMDGRTVITSLSISSLDGVESRHLLLFEQYFGLVIPTRDVPDTRPVRSAKARREPVVPPVDSGGGPKTDTGPPPLSTYRHAPADDVLQQVYRQCGGKVFRMADHFRVPASTVSGWLRRARTRGVIEQSKRSAKHVSGRTDG